MPEIVKEETIAQCKAVATNASQAMPTMPAKLPEDTEIATPQSDARQAQSAPHQGNTSGTKPDPMPAMLSRKQRRALQRQLKAKSHGNPGDGNITMMRVFSDGYTLVESIKPQDLQDFFNRRFLEDAVIMLHRGMNKDEIMVKLNIPERDREGFWQDVEAFITSLAQG